MQIMHLFLKVPKRKTAKNGFVTARRGVILGSMDITGKEAHAGCAYLEGRSAIL